MIEISTIQQSDSTWKCEAMIKHIGYCESGDSIEHVRMKMINHLQNNRVPVESIKFLPAQWI